MPEVLIDLFGCCLCDSAAACPRLYAECAVSGHHRGVGRRARQFLVDVVQRALLCDIRIAAEGARFRLPETTYGVIPDTGGVAVLHEMCGPGLVSDLVLTGRVLNTDEALAHGIVSRVVTADDLDATAREMAEQIAQAPAVTVKMARAVIRHLSLPTVRASMNDEMIYQTFINRRDDMAELRAARTEERPPRFTGS